MTTDFKGWEKQFKGDIKLTLVAVGNTLEATAKELFHRIEAKTPVGKPELWNSPPHKDYAPGFLKTNWKLSTTSGFRFSLRSRTQTITISNDAPYAQRVETGWSTQAPKGMMRTSVIEYAAILAKTASRFRIV